MIHEVFTPTHEQVEEARRILEAFESAGGGAAMAAGRFVDAAVARRARALLRLAETEVSA